MIDADELKSIANLDEFKQLIRTYESIEDDDIFVNKENLTDYHSVREVTGFGQHSTCTLCEAVPRETCWESDDDDEEHEVESDYPDCAFCAWQVLTDAKCFERDNRDTYNPLFQIDIGYNKYTKEQLIEAFKARAIHMRQVLSDNGLSMED